MRDHDFFVSLARELLDADWREMREDTRLEMLRNLRSPQMDDAIRRVERQHLEDASLELDSAVRALPGPLAQVVLLRASGLSFRSLKERLKGRAMFSIVDDWNTAMRRLWAEHEVTIRRIA